MLLLPDQYGGFEMLARMTETGIKVCFGPIL